MSPFRRHFRRLTLCPALCLAALLGSCGGDDGPSTPSIRPGAANPAAGKPTSSGLSIGGKDWKGVFYATDRAGRSGLSATITQDGSAIVITTSRPSGGVGHMLTGTVGNDGRIRLTDAANGEIWSTHFGPATGTYIKIADFTTLRSATNPRADFNIIELSRRGGTAPATVQATAPDSTSDPVVAANPAPATPKAPDVGGTPELPPTPAL